jgi:hypothetical protein
MAWKKGDEMSMLLHIHSESVLLKVVAEGRFSLKEGERTFLEMLDAIALYKSKKVLFDGRKLVGKPGTMERFYYGKFAAQAVASSVKGGVSTAPQFAYLLREPLLDPKRFGETVAVNRGMHVKAFESPEEAVLWLGIEPANKPDTGNAQ